MQGYCENVSIFSFKSSTDVSAVCCLASILVSEDFRVSMLDLVSAKHVADSVWLFYRLLICCVRLASSSA